MRIILIIGLLGGVAAPALAQAGMASAASDRIANPDEIVVTGEKTNRTIQHTTTSVAVTTPKRIEQENLLSIQDVYNRTANVSETYGSSGFTIRGITNTGVSGGGNADTATVYVDGAPIPSQALYGGPTDLWDIGQVEILRGPQSTIQGLNAMAGSVIITTADPTMDWHAAGRLLWTDRVDRTFSAAVGGPIVADQLAFRISADRIANRGFVQNITHGGYEDRVRSLNLRGKLLWTPMALPDLTAKLSYNRARRMGGYLFTFADASVPGYLDHPTSTANRPDTGRIASDIATLNLAYKLSDTLKLSSITSWNRVDVNSFSDVDTKAVDSAYLNNHFRFHTVTEEVRLNYDGERLSGVLGGWFYHRAEQFRAAQRVNVTTPVGTISSLLQGGGLPAGTANAIANAYYQALPIIPVDYNGDAPVRVTTAAVFGDARYKLTDRLSLIAGFRYDHEHNRFDADQSAVFVGTLPSPTSIAGAPPAVVSLINAGVLGLVASASADAPANARSFDAFLPKAGISMDWTPDITTAVTVQRGYRSGGSSQNTAKSSLVPYDPEYSWNYEGSLRSRWLGGKLTLNANLFYMKWKDQQVTVFFGSNSYDYNTVNAGKSHLWGFEVETAYRPSDTFDVYASVGHVQTRFDDFTIPSGTATNTDLAGSEFAYAPHWTIVGGANWRFARGFVANANVNWRAAAFSDVGADQSSSRVQPRAIVNTRVGYDAGHWGAFLNVRNLFDKRYDQYYDATRQVAVIGQPRTIGGELELRW